MSLWRLLLSLGEEGAVGALARPFSVSMAVVPPPVPAAIPAFEQNMHLLSTLKPVFFTLTSRTPYFSDEETIPDLSATQRAAELVRQMGSRPVLTITATMKTSSGDKGTMPNVAVTRNGVSRVLKDYFDARGGDSLLLMRGEDGGATLRSELAHISQLSSSTGDDGDPSPYADFHNGTELLRFVANSIPDAATLCIAGFPQGHPMDRQWGGGGRRESLEFLAALDAAGPMKDGAADWAADVCAVLDRVDHALRLGDAPSFYTADSARQAARDLVREKIIACGARVVITQMLSSAEEFFAFAAIVRAELCEAGGERVVIVPGIMAPLTATEFSRVLLFTKVVPSAALHQALRNFRDELHMALTLETNSGAEVGKVKRLHSKWMELDAAFQQIMLNETELMCRSLVRAGHRHLNFAAFNYKSAPALVQIIEKLERGKLN